jgi:hypothetical protein
MPLTCNGTVRYCGRIGDGCGRELVCAPCAAGQSCQGGFCSSPACAPVTCNITPSGRYCGEIGDGCGGALDCGACSGGEILRRKPSGRVRHAAVARPDHAASPATAFTAATATADRRIAARRSRARE